MEVLSLEDYAPTQPKNTACTFPQEEQEEEVKDVEWKGEHV